MTNPENNQSQIRFARRAFWTSATFYSLIAFEFFYMASPFAAYFYSVYGPGLDGLQQFGFSGWTIWFFLPHIVEETRSPLVNIAEMTGLTLFFGGLLGFIAGVFQVYRAKLNKLDAVIGGLYRYIRHPQYLALMIASIGMLLIWPRFLVLFSTCLVFLAYIFLAKAEENICLRQYDGYAAYMARTGRFLPRGWSLPSLPDLKKPWANAVLRCAAFGAVVASLTAAGFALRSHSIASVYTLDADRGVYLSVSEISGEDLARLAHVAEQSEAVQTELSQLDASDRFLAYVLPAQMYVSEIPMYLPEGESFGHSVPTQPNLTLYKVIFTRAVYPPGGVPDGMDIIARATNKYPLIEVHINIDSEAVEGVFQPPEVSFYPDVQVPVF